MDRKIFGQKIKNIRKIHKLTQEKLAELVDIDIRQIARIEAGESLPSIETLNKISKILCITPNDLLISTGNEKNSTKDSLKSDIYDILSLAKEEQLLLIKKLILAIL